MAQTVTLAELRTRTLGRAQMESDDEAAEMLDYYINEGCKYLRWLLHEYKPSGFHAEPQAASFTTEADEHTVALPENCEDLIGVDIQISGQWYPAPEFNFADRHKIGTSRPWSVMPDGWVNARYAMHGDRIFFQDPPDGEYPGRFWFVAHHETLDDEADEINLYGYEQLVIDYAAEFLLGDDELDAAFVEKMQLKMEAKIKKRSKRRNRGGHRSTRDVTGATSNLRWRDRERMP